MGKCDPAPLPSLSVEDAVRFWSHVDRSGNASRCWLWCASRHPQGYGTFRVLRVTLRAPRVAYLLATGVNPGRSEVCHRCDNPPCVNPAHLFLGSHIDNVHDMAAKGRAKLVHLRGEEHFGAKLNEQAVITIRHCLAHSVPRRRIAAVYGMSKSQIQRIASGVGWKGVAPCA